MNRLASEDQEEKVVNSHIVQCSRGNKALIVVWSSGRIDIKCDGSIECGVDCEIYAFES